MTNSPDARHARCWAITAYFNPVGFQTRLDNYRTFRERLQVPLLTVEWSVDGRYELAATDADVLVQSSSPDLLWQKERLLNIGLDALPDHVETVAWLDCDVIIRRDDWPDAVARELESAPIAQLFSRCLLPGPGASIEDLDAAGDVPSASSLVHLDRTLGDEAERFDRLWGKSISKAPQRDRLAGMAWAGRRDFLARHRFYDACVFGAGDRALACAAFRVHDTARQAWLRTTHQRRHYFDWAVPFGDEIAGRVGLVEGDLVHLWHGHVKDRQWTVRHEPAERNDFDPMVDIAVDPETGLWRWASPKEPLHRAVAAYFENRRENPSAR